MGIGDKGDAILQNAIYGVLAPTYPSGIPSSSNPSSAQDDVLVVLLTEDSIRNLYDDGLIQANEWPIEYSDHANIISRLMKYEARSVFVDVYFKRKRSTDDTAERFINSLHHAQNRSGTKLWFAGGYKDEDLSPWQEELKDNFGLTLNGWEGYGGAYPLYDDAQSSAAMDMYKEACLEEDSYQNCNNTFSSTMIDDGVSLPAVSVRWGARPAAAIFPEYTSEECNTFNWFDFVKQSPSMLFSEIESVGCPYSKVLYADDLVHIDKFGTEVEKARLSEAIKDKSILYGMYLEGLHDTVTSPVHGKLPGVMLHAMVLDNLITYGMDYQRATDEKAEQLSYIAWAFISFILAVIMWRLYGRDFYGKPTNLDSDENIWKRKRAIQWTHRVGMILVIIFSIYTFMILQYEPYNAIGFLVLIGAVGFIEDLIAFLAKKLQL